jgi:hypothetical protein
MSKRRKFNDQLDCRVCHAEDAVSSTIPVPTDQYTDIQWGVCPECGACYPKGEDYSDDAFDYHGQVKELVRRVRELRKDEGVYVLTAPINRDRFVTWYLGDLDHLKHILRMQARAIRRLLRSRRATR